MKKINCAIFWTNLPGIPMQILNWYLWGWKGYLFLAALNLLCVYVFWNDKWKKREPNLPCKHGYIGDQPGDCVWCAAEMNRAAVSVLPLATPQQRAMTAYSNCLMGKDAKRSHPIRHVELTAIGPVLYRNQSAAEVTIFHQSELPIEKELVELKAKIEENLNKPLEERYVPYQWMDKVTT